MSGAAAVFTVNTLSKLGAAARWQVEKCGVNPETVDIFIVASTDAEADKIWDGFVASYDQKVMSQRKVAPHELVVHGVRIHVGTREKA